MKGHVGVKLTERGLDRLVVKPFWVLSKDDLDEIGPFVKHTIFLVRLKVWGRGSFHLFQEIVVGGPSNCSYRSEFGTVIFGSFGPSILGASNWQVFFFVT